MFIELKKLFKHSGVYAIGAVAQAGLSFLLVPLYTRYMQEMDYGRLEIWQTIFKVVLFMIPLGLPSAILKCYHRDAKGREERLKLTSTAFWTAICASVIFSTCFFLAASLIGRSFLKTDSPFAIYILIFGALAAGLIEVFLAFLRAEERSRFYTVIFLARFILTIGVTFYLVIFLKLMLMGAILGIVGGQILTLVIFLPYFKNYVKVSYSLVMARKLLGFGLAVLPASVAMWILDLSDRYFLNYFRSLQEVAVYSVGYRIGYILEFGLVIPFQLAWPAFSFRVASQANHREIYSRVFTYFYFLGVLGVLVLSFFAKELIMILAPRGYIKGLIVVPLISLAYVFYGLHFVLATGIHLKRKSHYYPMLIIIPAILNIGLNYLLIPHYGMIGAAVATLTAFIFLFVFTYLVSNYLYPLKFEKARIGKLSLGFCLVGLLGYGLISRINTEWMLLVGKILLILILFFLLWILSFWQKSEKQEFLNLFTKKKSNV